MKNSRMKLYVKNMVCNRCVMVVRSVLEQMELHPTAITLGEVSLQEDSLTAIQHQQLETSLQHLGFELIDDRKSRIIEKIKNVVIKLVHYTEEQARYKHSDIIANELKLDYPYLSKLFSDIEGITIEQYIINQKIEKVKEYLVYNELTLSEIAGKMGYSSVAHLSAQFKKVTGLTPSHFKTIKDNKRIALDEVGSNIRKK